MNITVEILEGALKPIGSADGVSGREDGGVGARVVFEGVVREEESGKKISGLSYEAYLPMAERELKLLAEEMVRKHGLRGIAVEHSRGLVRVGEVSFRLIVWAAHRKEALNAMDEFIDRMKKDVPIWKSDAASAETR